MAKEGKIALITGVAQGSCARRMPGPRRVAIIGIDICGDAESMDYPNASNADLARDRAAGRARRAPRCSRARPTFGLRCSEVRRR